MYLGGELLRLNGQVSNLDEGKKKIEEVLTNGKALGKFQQMVIAQGVNKEIAHKLCENPIEVLPLAPQEKREEIKALKTGHITSLDALACGEVSRDLGNGRVNPTDSVTYHTGILFSATVGSHVNKDEVIATIYHDEEIMNEKLKAKIEKIQSGIIIADTQPINLPRVLDVL